MLTKIHMHIWWLRLKMQAAPSSIPTSGRFFREDLKLACYVVFWNKIYVSLAKNISFKIIPSMLYWRHHWNVYNV